jgi:HEAT repeat protein
MAMFPQLRQYDLAALQRSFTTNGMAPEGADEQELWLQEIAVQIAKSGPKGMDFLLSCAADADELRLRALLLALSLMKSKLSGRKQTTVCELARKLLSDRRAMVVAEAVDTLAKLACRQATEAVFALFNHPSPFVVGSALRFFARLEPERAVPLLEVALNSKEAIVRENAVDELDEMNWKAALPKIRRLLQDADEDVRQAARTAVEHLQKSGG